MNVTIFQGSPIKNSLFVVTLVAAFLLFAALVHSWSWNFFPSKSWTALSAIAAFVPAFLICKKFASRIRPPYIADTGRTIGRGTQIAAIVLISAVVFFVSWDILFNLGGWAITQIIGQPHIETVSGANGIQQRMIGRNSTRRPFRFVHISSPADCWGTELSVSITTPLSPRPILAELAGTKSFAGFAVDSYKFVATENN